MRQGKLRQWYRRRIRAEQKKAFLTFPIFPMQKRDVPASVFIEPELAMKSGSAFSTSKQEAPESLLELRRQKQILAWEGILLIKERYA